MDETVRKFWRAWVEDELHRRERLRRPMDMLWHITQSSMDDGMKRYAMASLLNAYFEDLYDYTVQERRS